MQASYLDNNDIDVLNYYSVFNNNISYNNLNGFSKEDAVHLLNIWCKEDDYNSEYDYKNRTKFDIEKILADKEREYEYYLTYYF